MDVSSSSPSPSSLSSYYNTLSFNAVVDSMIMMIMIVWLWWYHIHLSCDDWICDEFYWCKYIYDGEVSDACNISHIHSFIHLSLSFNIIIIIMTMLMLFMIFNMMYDMIDIRWDNWNNYISRWYFIDQILLTLLVRIILFVIYFSYISYKWRQFLNL